MKEEFSKMKKGRWISASDVWYFIERLEKKINRIEHRILYYDRWFGQLEKKKLIE